MAITVSLLLFVVPWCARIVGGQHHITLIPDSVYYATAAERVANGAFGDSLSAFWLPVIPYFAAPLVKAGLSSIHSILLLNGLSVAGTLILLYRFCEARFGSSVAQAAIWILASHSGLIQQSCTIASDSVFLLATFIGFECLSHPQRKLGAFAAAVLVWIRVPGLIVGAWMAVVSFRNKNLWPALCWLISVVLLCQVYYWKTGHFMPTLAPAINHAYMVIEWMGRDPLGFCRLYDGSHTLLSDFFFLKPLASVPANPALATGEVLAYRWSTCLRYVAFWTKIFPISTMPLILYGIFRAFSGVSTRRVATQGLSWCLVTTVGMVGSTVISRYFLPVLPVMALFAAQGIDSLKDRRWGRWLLPIVMVIQLIIVAKDTGLRSMVRNLTLARQPSVGQWLRTHYGAHQRVVSRWNFASIIEAGAQWSTLPCESDDLILQYLKSQKIGYWIDWRDSEAVVKRFEKLGVLSRLHETNNEVLYRVNYTIASTPSAMNCTKKTTADLNGSWGSGSPLGRVKSESMPLRRRQLGERGDVA